MIRLGVLVLAGISLGMAGCAKSDPTAEVRGKVTLDDQPLAEGEIYFVTPGMPPEILRIQDGTFAGKVRLGQRRVEINAYRPAVLPPTATIAGEPPKENFIPARYNSESTLQAEVQRPGPNQFEFSLKSN